MKWFQERMKTLFSRTLFGMLAISLTVLVITAVSLFVWFRTEMVVSLENHGPVTILVDSKKLF